MIRRSAFMVTAIALTTCTLVAPKASAEDFEVPFEGNISSICAFTVDTPGILTRDPNNGYGLIGNSNVAGTSAEVTANCSSPASVGITGIEQDGGPTSMTASASLYTEESGSGPGVFVNEGPTGIQVNMSASTNSNGAGPGTSIEDGTYIFNVLLTATPY